jgi:hypothetical protein
MLFFMVALLPSAVLLIAVARAVKTQASIALWSLGLSLGIGIAAVAVPALQPDEPMRSFRFSKASPEREGRPTSAGLAHFQPTGPSQPRL